MPSPRTSTRFVLFGSCGLLSFLENPKKLRLGLVSRIEMADSLSSSGSSDIERIFKTSVLLRIVVEQFICPPMKNLRFPSTSKSGAAIDQVRMTAISTLAATEKLANI